MVGKSILRDERGAVTVDWVALSAGIILLGMMVAISVMGNSSGYLMDEFESLNEQYQESALTVSELGRGVDINK